MAAKKNRAKAASQPEKTSGGSCFTIMPFGGWFDEYYTSVFRPAIEAAGLVPCRADDLYRPSTIINDIWAYTRDAKMILADLTGRNPNVLYELGLAHALAKPAILVTETIDDVPFDLRALRVIEYNKNAPNWGDVLRNKIEASIREIIASPLHSVLPTFLNVKATQTTPAVTPHEKEILELRRELELVRREMLDVRVHTARRVLPKTATDVLIEDYVRRGLSPRGIVARLVEHGAPENYVRNRVDELYGKQATHTEMIEPTVVKSETRE